MKTKIFQIFLLVSFFFIFIIFYKGLQNSNIYSPSDYIEKKIPSFTAQIFMSNAEINSNEIFNEDQFYLLNIWASWCVPCKEEHKFLMNLNNKKNLKIIGLNYKDKDKNAKNFLKKLNNPYDFIFSDKDGTISIEWGAYGVPETFLIYKRRIIKKIIGPLNTDSLLEIKRLIK